MADDSLQMEIDSTSIEERNGKVTLKARVYKGDAFQCECPVVFPASFYNDLMGAPGGTDTLREIVAKRVKDEMLKRQNNNAVHVQQALDLGSQRMPL